MCPTRIRIKTMKRFFLLATFVLLGMFAMAQDVVEGNDHVTANELVLADETITVQLMNDLQQANPDIKFSEEDYQMIHQYYSSGCPNKVAAGVLGILLGGIGVQHFYVGQTVRGVIDILFCWTGIPALVGLVEGIIWLCEDDAAFESKFCH